MKYFNIFLIIAVLFTFTGCGAGGKNSEKDFLGKEASYAIGFDIGLSFANDNIIVDVKALTRGLKDAMSGNARYDIEEMYMILQQAFDTISETRIERNKIAEKDFLKQNLETPGIIVTESGLRYEIINEGDGQKPAEDDIVLVNYKGALINGNVFEDSSAHTHPEVFPIYELFPGLTEALTLMKVGSTHRIYIPSELAYGEIGRGSEIPPYSALIFDIELLSIEDIIPFFGYEPCCFYDFDNDDW